MRRLVSDARGFTLVEVTVSAAVLLVGVLGVVGMLDQAQSATGSTRAREGAVNLQRELIEGARSIPYEQLAPASVGSLVRAQPALGDSNLGSGGWTIRRRGFTYTVTIGECAVDDPRDGTGAHDPGVFCATGAGTTTAQQCADLLGPGGTGQGSGVGATTGDCGVDVDNDGTVDGLIDSAGTSCGGSCADSNPSDYKRIVSLIRWGGTGGRRWVLQATTLANPGLSAAPAVTQLTTPTTTPVTTATSLSFSVTAQASATAVSWYLDGTQRGTATASGAAWSFWWPLGLVSEGAQPNADEVLDGSYLVAAKAFDRYGQFGASRALTIVVNRRVPYPPQHLEAGRNGAVVELEWRPNKEGDIAGYLVYRQPADGAPVEVCTLTQATACRDSDPPADAALDYYAVAVDKDAVGNLREGQHSETIAVRTTNTPPPEPSQLTASSSNGNTVLTWTAPSGDPDPGDRIDHYTIYRDGQAYADRYDRTASGDALTFTDTRADGQAHTYWVTAVDTQLAESLQIGPVTR